MTENYYLTQIALPAFFKSEKNKEFFYKVIGTDPRNLDIFIMKELYSFTKTELFKRDQINDGKEISEEEKVWKYSAIRTALAFLDNKNWITFFIKFPTDFATKELDCLTLAIAMKGNPENDIKFRLFFLEAGTSFMTNKKCLFLCEKEIESGKHINYSSIAIDDMYMVHFKEKLEEILHKDK